MLSSVSKIIVANRRACLFFFLFFFLCYEISFWVRAEGQIIPKGGEQYRVLQGLNHSIGLCALLLTPLIGVLFVDLLPEGKLLTTVWNLM